MNIRRVKWLDERFDSVRRPQCEHTLNREALTPGYQRYLENRIEKRGLSADHCGKFATHEVDGLLLCSQHAGQLALEHMTDRKTKVVIVKKQKPVQE